MSFKAFPWKHTSLISTTAFWRNISLVYWLCSWHCIS